MARGDHIKVSRMRGLYTHHGIDLGDGTVVHFAGEPLRAAAADIRRESIELFLRGGRARYVRYREEILDVEASVARALELVGATGYHLWTNNCEHFAVYCKTGKRHSAQVRRAALGTAAALGASVALTGVVVGARVIAGRVASRG